MVVQLPFCPRTEWWVLRLQVRVATMYANALACERTASDQDGKRPNSLTGDYLGKAVRHVQRRRCLLELALQLQACAMPRHVILCIVEFLEDSAILLRTGRGPVSESGPVSEPFGREDILQRWVWMGRRERRSSDQMNQWATSACWGVS